MKSNSEIHPKPVDAMRSEYRFDYMKAAPNRFVQAAQPGSAAILLDPDVAQVFKNANRRDGEK